ncbi:Nitrate excretion transporter 1, putative [Theobroma cacao]|uniref:Nitrate excretion transporter 1, putative n=1 Tax=Theobroma cacao TaxID=3641 RepID=A0A061FUL8_THECC|nr:Nitrate excretion transporter 1, putative [Theobroma cacao]
MVVFQYGSLVIFNVREHEVDEYLKIVEKHASGLLPEMRKDALFVTCYVVANKEEGHQMILRLRLLDSLMSINIIETAMACGIWWSEAPGGYYVIGISLARNLDMFSLLRIELEQIEGSKLSSQRTSPNEDGKTTMDHKGGGWTTFLFIIGSMTGLSLVAGGWGANLIVFLINEFHVKSITATQINNVILGCNYLLPIAGAIVADTFFDSYTVIITFAFVSLLGMILLTLTTTIHSLKPSPCAMGASTCPTPSKLQFAVLYIALALASLGVGGTRFTIATMGADQFDDAKDQGIFFNWYFLALYIANCVSLTALIYIQDNVSWGLAFGICTVLNAIALVLFLSGKRFYRRIKPKRSPFLSILCVIFAAIRKRNVPGTFGSQDYYYGSVETTNIFNNGPSIGEAFHFPGQIALYYQEFPKSLKGWLPDNINHGRLDNVFWMLAVIGVVNLGYYLVCAKLFKYQNLEKSNDSGSHVH